MSDLWTEASVDAEAEHAQLALTRAKVACASLWPFLAMAQSPNEFEHRLALADNSIVERVPVPLYDQVLASLREDFRSITAMSDDDAAVTTTNVPQEPTNGLGAANPFGADTTQPGVSTQQQQTTGARQITASYFDEGLQRWVKLALDDDANSGKGNPWYFTGGEEAGPQTGRTEQFPTFPVGNSGDPWNPMNSQYPMQPAAWTTPPGGEWKEEPMQFSPPNGARQASAEHVCKTCGKPVEHITSGVGKPFWSHSGAEGSKANDKHNAVPVRRSSASRHPFVADYTRATPEQLAGWVPANPMQHQWSGGRQEARDTSVDTQADVDAGFTNSPRWPHAEPEGHGRKPGEITNWYPPDHDKQLISLNSRTAGQRKVANESCTHCGESVEREISEHSGSAYYTHGSSPMGHALDAHHAASPNYRLAAKVGDEATCTDCALPVRYTQGDGYREWSHTGKHGAAADDDHMPQVPGKVEKGGPRGDSPHHRYTNPVNGSRSARGRTAGGNPEYFAGGAEGVAGDQQSGFPQDVTLPEDEEDPVSTYGAVPPQQSHGTTGAWRVATEEHRAPDSDPNLGTDFASSEEAERYRKGWSGEDPGSRDSSAKTGHRFFDPGNPDVRMVRTADADPVGDTPETPPSMTPGGPGAIAGDEMQAGATSTPQTTKPRQIPGGGGGGGGGENPFAASRHVGENRARPTTSNPFGTADPFDATTWDAQAHQRPTVGLDHMKFNGPQNPMAREPIRTVHSPVPGLKDEEDDEDDD